VFPRAALLDGCNLHAAALVWLELHLAGFVNCTLVHRFIKLLQEILTETERVVGSNKGISEKPIRLKIYSPNVL